MAESFISQLGISRIEVYNMKLSEKNLDAVKILDEYYKALGDLIEKFIWEYHLAYGKLYIEGAYYVSYNTHADYFRNLLRTLRLQYPQEPHHSLGLVRSEILGLVASARQNLENLIH
jgi:hypothetical protein